MRFNLEAWQDYIKNGKHAYIFSTPDKASLMHYWFDPKAYTDGTSDPCYIAAQNTVPSEQDLDAIKSPTDPRSRLFKCRREA